MKRIGSYEALDLLGEGGMGGVYRGRDPRFDRDVAIKVLHAQFQRDPGVIERFKSEAVIQAKLSHPHIVTVLDFVADAESLAIVMEYVEGKPLSQAIEESGPMAPARAAHLMGQVLGAMGYAHSKGLVHRDIKPSNIMVQEVGGQEFAKVMDFGIAKILGSEKLKTATGAKMGTLAYMSPEHVKSPKHVDARSDIYSLGVVLYEMLTGRVPFDADSEYELMRQIVEQPPPTLARTNELVVPRLTDVVARALAKDPARRFQDCEGMRSTLAEPDRHRAEDGADRVGAAIPPFRHDRSADPSLAPSDIPSGSTAVEGKGLGLPHPPSHQSTFRAWPWAAATLLLIGTGWAAMSIQEREAVRERRREQAQAEDRQAQHQAELQRLREEAERARRQAEEVEQRRRRAEAAQQAAAATQLPGRWPESGVRVLTEDDLAGLSASELRVMRNEIYARHGRRFQSADLRSYFESQRWYVPLTDGVPTLSRTEMANVEFILRAEQKRGR